MKHHASILLSLITVTAAISADYTPPATGIWDTASPADLGWNTTTLPALGNWLDTTGTRGFIILSGGKIAYEHYGPGLTKDSAWYWASAGKSLCSFLIGTAQEQGLLAIDSPTTDYLGRGWSSIDSIREDRITIRHQLTMTTGLNDTLTLPGIDDVDNCLEPQCLQYLADPGTRWAYHNAPYRLLHKVLDDVTPSGHNAYTNAILGPTGFKGLWIDHIMYSTPRNMARYGLLVLRKGIWGSDTILHDDAYFNAMTTPSQSINHSYGYLWWLNGRESFMLPDLQLQIQGSAIPSAPADMVMALGKNDQKIHIIPSLNMVIVRMGTMYSGELPVPIQFDRDLWDRLNQIFNTSNNIFMDGSRYQTTNTVSIRSQRLFIPAQNGTAFRIVNLQGRNIISDYVNNAGTDISKLPPGPMIVLCQNNRSFLIH